MCSVPFFELFQVFLIISIWRNMGGPSEDWQHLGTSSPMNGEIWMPPSKASTPINVFCYLLAHDVNYSCTERRPIFNICNTTSSLTVLVVQWVCTANCLYLTSYNCITFINFYPSDTLHRFYKGLWWGVRMMLIFKRHLTKCNLKKQIVATLEKKIKKKAIPRLILMVTINVQLWKVLTLCRYNKPIKWCYYLV